MKDDLIIGLHTEFRLWSGIFTFYGWPTVKVPPFHPTTLAIYSGGGRHCSKPVIRKGPPCHTDLQLFANFQDATFYI